jgi:hypothetical protein
MKILPSVAQASRPGYCKRFKPSQIDKYKTKRRWLLSWFNPDQIITKAIKQKFPLQIISETPLADTHRNIPGKMIRSTHHQFTFC